MRPVYIIEGCSPFIFVLKEWVLELEDLLHVIISQRLKVKSAEPEHVTPQLDVELGLFLLIDLRPVLLDWVVAENLEETRFVEVGEELSVQLEVEGVHLVEVETVALVVLLQAFYVVPWLLLAAYMLVV